MHEFIIFCLVAVTTAKPLAYNYPHPGQIAAAEGIGPNGYEAGEQPRIDIRFGDITSGASNAHDSGLSGFDNSIDATGFGRNGVIGNNNGFDTFSGHNGINSNPSHIEYNKVFYTYSAPEENFSNDDSSQEAPRINKKNLRVIFIKAPENKAFMNAALQLAKQASEAHTAIYVLAKQTDIGTLANQLQTINSLHANKPEVHFVKYRTPAEALHAQQYIQSQYDSLSGPTHSSNEGVAAVLNFASSSPSSSLPAVGGFSGNTNGNSHGNGIGFAGSSNRNVGYLPPAVKRS